MQYAGSTGDPLPFHLAEAWITEGAAADRSVSAARVIVEDQAFPIYRLLFALTEARHALRRGRRAAASHSLAEAGSLLATMQGAAFLGWLAEDMRLELEAVHRAGMSEALNPREVEILTEIAAGSSRREAARNLHLSINTVKTYLRTAYRKLGATDRHDAVIEARRLGLIDGSDTPSRDAGAPGARTPGVKPAGCASTTEPSAAAGKPSTSATLLRWALTSRFRRVGVVPPRATVPSQSTRTIASGRHVPSRGPLKGVCK